MTPTSPLAGALSSMIEMMLCWILMLKKKLRLRVRTPCRPARQSCNRTCSRVPAARVAAGLPQASCWRPPPGAPHGTTSCTHTHVRPQHAPGTPQQAPAPPSTPQHTPGYPAHARARPCITEHQPCINRASTVHQPCITGHHPCITGYHPACSSISGPPHSQGDLVHSTGGVPLFPSDFSFSLHQEGGFSNKMLHPVA